eukprot:1148860-Pelagomonas_calceolata.AAC.4
MQGTHVQSCCLEKGTPEHWGEKSNPVAAQAHNVRPGAHKISQVSHQKDVARAFKGAGMGQEDSDAERIKAAQNLRQEEH